MIPLERLGDYSDGIERINIELSIRNKLRLCDALGEFLGGDLPLHQPDADLEADELIGDRRARRDRAPARRCAGAGSGCSTSSTCRWPKPRAASPNSASSPGRSPTAWRRRRCSTGCRIIRCACRGSAKSSRSSTRFSTACRSARCWSRIAAIQPGRAARPRVRRAAHARRRRQRAYQPAGELRPLRNAAGGQQRGGAHHGAGALAGRCDLRRAWHRHHQARVPVRSPRSPPSSTTSSASTRRAASTRASCCRAPICARLHAIVLAARRRVADHGAERHRRASPIRSRTACAAASASRCARPTCRAPTCSTARATRSSPPPC